MSNANQKNDVELSNIFETRETFPDNLTEQLRMAGRVQRDFLPRQLPNSNQLHWATTFLPAEWVSGDIYDVVRLDEGHIGFYLADVVGHGMPAALLTVFLKQSLVMRQTIGNSYKIFSPSEVIKNLNLRIVKQQLSGNQFITCCYCLLNTDTMELTYARGGHPYPVLIKQGQLPEQLRIQGSLLGIFEDAEFPEKTVQLEKTDKVMLYSDGVEPFIGKLNDLSNFSFTDEFCKIKDLPVLEMNKKLNKIIQKQKINPSEIDDITVVVFEVV
ncbi:MAG: PP2C family protein-serine/threonine phosphatase [Planctomycetota bacterium]|jgi:sigma-B regulation protein RsbU (phosphoserine phosphatase)